jgi:hypothetical protein
MLTIIFTAIGWILYQLIICCDILLTDSSPAKRPPEFQQRYIIQLLSILSPVAVITPSLFLYFSDFPSPILWWLVTIASANIIAEILMALFFYEKRIIVANSIMAPLTAIGIVLPFWLIAQINILWTYKILIMVPAFFLYFSLGAQYLIMLTMLLTIPIGFLISPLIFIEKRIRKL